MSPKKITALEPPDERHLCRYEPLCPEIASI
jgi:hypothetical protein